jgi:hypothetical protein
MNIQILIILMEIAHRYIYDRHDPSTCTYNKQGNYQIFFLFKNIFENISRVDEIHFLLVCQTYKKVCKKFSILEFDNFNKNIVHVHIINTTQL